MNTTKILLAVLLASAFAPAMASDADDAQSANPQRTIVINTRDIEKTVEAARLEALDNVRLSGMMTMVHDRARGKPVKGAPYSAELINEQVQNLADGNQIVTRQSTMNFRDGAGRTRQETRSSKGEVQVVTINDAVDGKVYVLHPRDKSVMKISLDHDAAREAGRAAADAARAGAEQARQAAREAGKTAAAAARESAQAARDAAQTARDSAQATRERSDRGERAERVERSARIERVDGKEIVNVRVEQGGPINVRVEPRLGDLGAIQANVNMALAGAFNDARWSQKMVSKDLGSKEIDGVKAEGKLRSYEIPAGEVGNRNAIVVSDESWYSPELQVTVYAKHSDPRTGERIIRLANLKREEPAASLFAVPADYAVKDARTTTVIERTTTEKHAEKK